MIRIKTFLADGSNPNGRIFPGDLNAIQDAAAALTDLTQHLSVADVTVGESGLQIVRYGSLEARITGALRTDGIVLAGGGVLPPSLTTTQRNALSSPPTGLTIYNSTTARIEYNAGTSGSPNWQPIGNQISSGVDVLANRPAANAVVAGSTYFATDQVVDYVSNGSTWSRKGLPAGATLDWFKPDAAIPTGWVAYDNGTLPSSTGIYADLYAHLGNTTQKPDTRGRVTVGQGSHADVDAIGDNDGVTLANRTPVHNSTVTDPGHHHAAMDFDNIGGDIGILGTNRSSTHNSGSVKWNTDDATTGITVGPGGSRPNDRVPWITGLKIAKL